MRFVKTRAEDERVSELLQKKRVIGIDFEWKPDEKGTSNKISLAQVCDGETCYIWCLFHFNRRYEHASGLHALLSNKSVLKVGCGMRGNDLAKLHCSALSVCEPVIHKQRGQEKLFFTLPDHFIDVQDWKIGTQKNVSVPYTGLYFLMAIFLRRTPSTSASPAYCPWHFIETSLKIRLYTITDAYAVFLLWHMYFDQHHIAQQYMHRDDIIMNQKVHSQSLYAPHKLADASNPPPDLHPLPPPDISKLFSDNHNEHLTHVDRTPEWEHRRQLHINYLQLLKDEIARENHTRLQQKALREQHHSTTQNYQSRMKPRNQKPFASPSNYKQSHYASDASSSSISSSTHTTVTSSEHAHMPKEASHFSSPHQVLAPPSQPPKPSKKANYVKKTGLPSQPQAKQTRNDKIPLPPNSDSRPAPNQRAPRKRPQSQQVQQNPKNNEASSSTLMPSIDASTSSTDTDHTSASTSIDPSTSHSNVAHQPTSSTQKKPNNARRKNDAEFRPKHQSSQQQHQERQQRKKQVPKALPQERTVPHATKEQ